MSIGGMAMYLLSAFENTVQPGLKFDVNTQRSYSDILGKSGINWLA